MRRSAIELTIKSTAPAFFRRITNPPSFLIASHGSAERSVAQGDGSASQ